MRNMFNAVAQQEGEDVMNGESRFVAVSRHDVWRKVKDSLFAGVFLTAIVLSLLTLAFLLGSIIYKGHSSLTLDFLTNYPSRFASQAGIKAALAGTFAFVVITAPLTFVIGVCSAIYLEEYAPRNWFTKLLEINIANLAGIPSIVYGMLGLVLFVRGLDLGRSVLAGALTMTLLVLPVIIVASQEAIRAVPISLRHASFALGGTLTQTVFRVVLPVAMPGILTGTILAISRAIGETAPLLTIGALTYVAFLPNSLLAEFTVLPIQIFNWVSRPQVAFQDVAAAGIIVLLAILLLLNSAAIVMRDRFRRRMG